MDTDVNRPLLKEVCETPGVPGYEQAIRKVVLREMKPLADELRVDNIGNVIAMKKGRERKRAMVAAHMDEIGFIVKAIDENGFLHFHPLGGFDPKTLTSQRVIVHGRENLLGVMGSKPVHLMTQEEKEKKPKIEDYFIDLGLPAAEVMKLVRVGDVVTRERELVKLGHCFNCKSLDNRVSVFILIEAMKKLKDADLPYDVYAVFTVQEEVGLRGVGASALQIQPDFGFGLDTTIAFDVPGAKPHEMVTSLGHGAAIKIMDASTICDYRMVDFMKQTADRHKIRWQPEILPAGGTDTAGLQRMTPGGSIAGAISVPTRHIHQVIETVHEEDVAACIELLANCLQDLDKHNWEF